MSSSYTPWFEFEEDTALDGPVKCRGRLRFHHTSDTVIWEVEANGKVEQQAVFWDAELDALRQAIESCQEKP